MSAIEPLTSDPPPDSAAERREVLDYVRDKWCVTLGEAECEDSVAEAYVALLERIRLRDVPPNRVGWLKKTGWRIANDAYKRNKRWAAENGDGNLDRIADGAASPAEHVALRDLDGRLKEAYEQLPKSLRLALASEFADRFTVEEICRRLRCRRSTLMHRRTKAREYLYAAATGENERFDDAVIAMMAACLSGAAAADQQQRVHALRSRSPYYAARFAELRAVDERLPAIVAPTVLADPTIFERAGSALGSLRESLHGVASRNPEAAEAAAAPALISGPGKAGGAAAGGLGGALGIGGGAAKLALTCGGAAATAACVAAIAPGVEFPGVREREQPSKPAAVKQAPKPVVASPGPAPEILPGQVGNEAPPTAAAEPAPAPPPAPPPSDDPAPAAEPAVSEPVPVEEASSSDFSFGAESSSTAPTPAPAPATASSGGGGTESSDGGTDGGDFAFGQ